MTKPLDSLPEGWILRPARESDRRSLQKLVLQFLQAEALGFDLRILAFRLLAILGLVLLALGQVLLSTLVASGVLRLTLMISIGYTFLLAIASIIDFTNYIIYIFTEPLFYWKNYYIVEFKGKLIACCALSITSNHANIYHLFVDFQWRRRGLATALVKHLISQASFPLYLVCKPKLLNFYLSLGFAEIPWHKLPPDIKPKFNIFKPHIRLWGYPLKIMQYRQPAE